jgi:thiamine-monophosphate kinase
VRTPGAEELVRHHDAPAVDLSLGWGAGRAARAMMDLSDGLVRDGGRLAAASAVRIDLDPAALAPDVSDLAPLAAELGEEPWSWVLHGAEEHAMLAAFAPDAVPVGFRPIGRVLAPREGAPAVTLDGAPIPGEGFDHFG